MKSSPTLLDQLSTPARILLATSALNATACDRIISGIHAATAPNISTTEPHIDASTSSPQSISAAEAIANAIGILESTSKFSGIPCSKLRIDTDQENLAKGGPIANKGFAIRSKDALSHRESENAHPSCVRLNGPIANEGIDQLEYIFWWNEETSSSTGTTLGFHAYSQRASGGASANNEVLLDPKNMDYAIKASLACETKGQVKADGISYEENVGLRILGDKVEASKR